MLIKQNPWKVLCFLCLLFINQLMAISSPLNWNQLLPTNSPAARFDAAFAFDPISGNLLLFGGNNGNFGYFSDTWIWNGSNWVQLSPATSPPARAAASMAFDPISGRLILFGGYNGSILNDTWAWTGSNWVQLTPSTSPSPQFAASMSLDPHTGNLLLFGGQSTGFSFLNETWLWTGNNWQQLSPATSPSPRRSAAMASDPITGQLILFGGSNPLAIFDDTWTWNGTTWIQLFPTNSPAPRTNAVLALDSTFGQLILFGGFNSSSFPNDTWTWNGNNWVILTTQTSPGGRSGPSMAFDFSSLQFILFGGADAAKNDTWTFIPLPTVTNLSPSSGSTIGGTVVTITGTGFSGASVVKFGSTSAQSFVVDSATQITAVSPPGSSGIVDVTVTTSVGTSLPSSGSQFTYISHPSVPTVISLSPSAGPTSGGTVVTITGTNFTAVSTVNFGSTPAQNFIVDSATQITAVSPPGSPGIVNVTVTTPFGTSATSAGSQFTYTAHPLAPTVASLSPSSGPTSGGTSVIITGSNFIGVSAVNFGSIPAQSFTVDSTTQITALSPVSPAGVVNVIITNSFDTSVPTAGSQFTYVPDILAISPAITNVSPSFGPTSGGTAVTIRGENFEVPIGTNFSIVTSVRFGATPALSFTVDSPTQITAVSPPGSPGTVDIIVATPNNASLITPTDRFTYLSVLPPSNFKGFQKANRFAAQTDLVNVLTWNAPLQGNSPIAYLIYRDANLTQLIAKVPGDRFKFKDHNRKKGRTYRYFIVSVDQFGNISPPATVKVRG